MAGNVRTALQALASDPQMRKDFSVAFPEDPAGTLIATAGYLCSALSRAVRAADPPESLPVTATPTLAFLDADQPLRSALLLAASMSHRGPPVGAVR